MSFMQLSEEHRVRVLEIAQRHGAHSVRIFGSRARDEGSESSDLDLLVEMERGRSLLDLIDMQRDIEEALRMKVDLLTPGSLSPYLRQAVEESAIPL